jgi:predicted dehydrogenase
MISMQDCFGLIGLGNISPSYIDAFHQSHPNASLYGVDPHKEDWPKNIQRKRTIEELCQTSPDLVCILTPPNSHVPILQEVIALTPAKTKILCEKPATIDPQEIETLKGIIEAPNSKNRVLLADHWLGRFWALKNLIQKENVSRLEGFLIEPSGIDHEGKPTPLDFRTGELDKRDWIHQHPNGVILDTMIHPFNLLAALFGGSSEKIILDSEKSTILDRFGKPIQKGDVTTAEGTATLNMTIGGIPTEITANKYGGETSKKGVTIHVKQGGHIKLRGTPQGDLLTEYTQEGRIAIQTLYNERLYQRFIKEFALTVFNNPALLHHVNTQHLQTLERLFGIHASIR